MKRIVSVVLVIAVICMSLFSVSADDVTEQTPLQNTATDESGVEAQGGAEVEPDDQSNGEVGDEIEYDAINYLEYIDGYKATNSEDIVLSEAEALVSRGGELILDVAIPTDSWYNLEITYKATESDTGEISFALLVDGKLPFSEADQFILPRRYTDGGEIRQDGIGNEFTPLQVELYETQTRCLSSYSTFSTEESRFFFGAGEHQIKLLDFGAEVIIQKVRLVGITELSSYSDTASGYDKYSKYNGGEILIEGESACYKSQSDLVAKSDSTTPAVYPNDPFKQKVNYIGSNWSGTGEELVWKIDVKESGLYKLSFHYRQSYILNGNSYRRLKIDGVTPFSEAGMIAFPYGSGWQSYTFADENGVPYLIYLDAGEHELSLDVTLGPLATFCTGLEDIVYELGEWYRRIVMITGEKPDSNRDYNLFSQIPDMEKGFQDLVARIEALVESYEKLTGERGGSTVSILNGMKNALNSMLKYKYKAQNYKASYYSNYSSVSATLYELMSMPLDIDTTVLSAPEGELQKGKVGFFKSVGYSAQRFLASFIVNYNNISGESETDESLVLWINWGRDQAQALNSLIQSNFVPENNIGVSVKITNASLVQGILSGNAPDCVLQHGRSEPVNLAMRGAAYDLSKFSDFNEVITRFAEGATVPYEYNGGVYALPDTQSFMMMFIRTDIFEQMGLEIPETWEEFISVMKTLSGNNLETGVTTGFNMFLAQHGGNLYNEELNATDLLSTSAITAFEFYTDFFTKYGCPKSYNFYNRFRTGLMPMGIQDYGMYATLKATAPEINDRWTMVPVPEITLADGSQNRYSCGGGTACMILGDSPNADAAWKFLKWWTSDETQLSYDQSLESVLGIAGRIATSNINAASRLVWDGDCFDNLYEQWGSVKEFNEVPGSYYTTRVIEQAYWNVVENNENPKDMLYRWSSVADNEIARKIKQYQE